MKPKKFKDLVSSLVQMLEIGEIGEDLELQPYKFRQATTTLRPYEELIVRTLNHSVTQLLEAKHYRPDEELSLGQVQTLFILFIRRVKRTKLYDNMPDDQAKALQEEAVAKLQEVMDLIQKPSAA